jgi:hypothetical protein
MKGSRVRVVHGSKSPSLCAMMSDGGLPLRAAWQGFLSLIGRETSNFSGVLSGARLDFITAFIQRGQFCWQRPVVP